MLPIALALAQFAPMIAGLFGGPKAEDVATKVVGIAQAVTGQTAPDAALKAIQADPNLALQFQKAVLDQQTELARIAAQENKDDLTAQTTQVESVNKTLQTEAMGGSWLQRNHHAIESMFTCGLIGAIYFVLPLLGKPVPPVPESAFLMLGGILGVTAWMRGKANAAVASQG